MLLKLPLTLFLLSMPADAGKTAAGGGIADCSYKDEFPTEEGKARFYREQDGFKLFISPGTDKQPRFTYVCLHADKALRVSASWAPRKAPWNCPGTCSMCGR